MNRAQVLPECACNKGFYPELISPHCKECSSQCETCSNSKTCDTCLNKNLLPPDCTQVSYGIYESPT